MAITRPEEKMQNVTSAPEDQPSDVDRFVERFALLLADAGLGRMPSRVFGALLVTDDGKLTAGALADNLRVSPAAISGAVRYLVQVGLIVRRRDPGERRDHYEVTEDLWYEAFANRDTQMKTWAEVMAEGVAAVGHDTNAGRRLETSRQFFEFLREQMPELMRKWREYQQAPPR
ncbi:GbsR/MarR family transcriptional regulator [Actinophytocola algeriensis]|uniref:DNA-binding transcriptional regulator GbsR (MarR family) n=1 Tax=Actinophytocola algeriensis TaxID=1768010 RepID=A0A7W7Q4R9_9PSEU|nr:MarR family transcriptional regulator [Actinophytocola algeriensis]MBB4907056.1 DNA-binding transcriptional regulator GbsR (MarR family) [Actinophytocola algeriensis]MBE1478539.1 DNA-binding transcriptional regulator GbsR (MarR family) [Actinophytocola algeriensis]